MITPKKTAGKIITFMDLGAGARAERLTKMAQRRHLRERKLEAVDLEFSPLKYAAGKFTYTPQDATQRINELLQTGNRGKVINGDNFFAEQSIGKKGLGYLQGIERCRATIKDPIDPELLGAIKKFLLKNGKLYTTTVKWHADPLVAKLKEAGFEVRARPLTEKEAMEGPHHTRGFYEMWRNGEFHFYFGKAGWEMQRIVATKRGD